MATDLKLKTGTISNYNNITTKETGTIYFATDSDSRAYIYLNGNNIVPKMVDLRNGGLGIDYSNSTTYPAYSVIMLGSDGKTTTTSAPAAGAFYTDASSNKPKFGTLPVAQGGLGKTSITKGAILYGNTSSTTGAVATLSPGTNGYVLVSTGSAPKYVQPTMSWTNGSTAGPIFNFTFNGVTNAGVAIPKASDSISGIVTTGTQTMTGEKTWMSTTYASSIYPRTSGSYSLGYYASSSDYKLWNQIHVQHLNVYGAENKLIIQSSETETNISYEDKGSAILTIGNTGDGTSLGDKDGMLRLAYGTGYASLSAVGTGTYILPSSGGMIMIRTGEVNNTTAQTWYIPFQTSMSVFDATYGYNDGFRLYHQNGTTSTTAGKSYLYLGNSTKVGLAGNKEGRILLYGDNTGSTTIRPNQSNSTSTYTVSLPAASGELVYHTEDAAQGGSGRLISVTTAGQIVADTSTDIANDIKLMYLKDGLLTASSATKGSDTKLIYLFGGAITESISTVASGTELMYLSSGTLTKSSANVANGKKQLMYLASGKLTASDADEGSGVKPVYLSKGVITASSSSVAKSTQLMYMSSGTLTASTADVGSATQPVYLLDGVVTAAGAYSSLLTAFSGADSASDNTMSITVGGTTDTATIIGGVSNTWTNGTTNGPTLSTTVNGITGTAVQIPNASYSYSGAVTTSTQTFKGVKTFGDGMKVSAAGSTTDCATFTYDASTDTLTISFP